MDTTEQLNGKYFFNGMSNLSAGELAFWIVVDEAQKQLGVEDIFSLALIIGGIPMITTRSKIDAAIATKGTSPFSWTMQKLVNHKLETRWR